MARSIYGLDAAGEWHQFQQLLPNFAGKDVIDLGCGYGWHCRYAMDMQANSVIGLDLSEKMINEAKEMTNADAIMYDHKAIEDIEFGHEQFDEVISSLAFHYVSSFEDVCKKIYTYLKHVSRFVFSVEFYASFLFILTLNLFLYGLVAVYIANRDYTSKFEQVA